jgi:hypothetical protein
MDAHNKLGPSLGPLRKLCIALSTLLALLWAAGANDAVAQDSNCAPYSTYCLAGIANVQTDVPTTSFGGGGQVTLDGSTQNPYYPGNAIVYQKNWTLSGSLLNRQSVTAVDPCGNDLLTVNASADIYQAFINPGQLAEWVASSGGSADSQCVGVTGSAIGELDWFDQITVTGLPNGTPVTLLVTTNVWGTCTFLGVFNPNVDGYPCSTTFQLGSLLKDHYYDRSGPINSHHVYRVQTSSGSILPLYQQMRAQLCCALQGSARWNSSLNGSAMMNIDVVTPGAAIFSGSDADYSTQADLIAVPQVASDAESTAVGNLTLAGLSIGSITTAPSTQVAAGVVMDSVPAAGSEVAPMFPVSLVVSSGVPPLPCGADASGLASVTLSGFRYNATSKLYDQTATVTNTSASTIPGPINVVVESLSANATLQNTSGATSCFAPGSPHVTRPGPLKSGESIEVPLRFSDPTHQAITWTAEVDAGGTP